MNNQLCINECRLIKGHMEHPYPSPLYGGTQTPDIHIDSNDTLKRPNSFVSHAVAPAKDSLSRAKVLQNKSLSGIISLRIHASLMVKCFPLLRTVRDKVCNLFKDAEVSDGMKLCLLEGGRFMAER